MTDLSTYQGIGQFGKAYKFMFENDPHAPGSVDRVLLENMTRVCSETSDRLYKEYTPKGSFYEQRTRPKLEHYVQKVTAGCHSDEEYIEAISEFTSRLRENVSGDQDTILFGGTEEEIITRGSDWCPDVARVGCVLCQVAGLPARMVYLVDPDKAYSGHAIVEVYRAKAWGAVDTLTNVVYCHSTGEPASTWDLMINPQLVECHWRGESTPYTTVDQFREAAISYYFVWRWKEYDYAVSRINDYYRSILKMSDQGWPGGLRWLHREDIC